MIIQVDQEGANAIAQLCDTGLKTGGMASLQFVEKVLTSIKPIPPAEPEPEPEPEEVPPETQKNS